MRKFLRKFLLWLSVLFLIAGLITTILAIGNADMVAVAWGIGLIVAFMVMIFMSLCI